MFSKNRERWRWPARLGGALLLSFFLLLISLPNLLDLDNYRPKIVKYLQLQLAGEVSVGKLSLTYKHGPGLRIDGVRVYDKSGSQHLLVTTIIANFDFHRLLEKRLHLARLTLVRPALTLQLDRKLSTLNNFLQTSAGSAGGPNRDIAPAGWKVDSEVSGALVEVVDGSVEFTDACFGLSPMTTRVKHLNLFFSWPATDLQTKFKLTATVTDKGGDGSLNIEGSLSHIRLPLEPGKMILDCKVQAENLNAGTYFPYYQKYVPMRFIGGRVDIDANYDGSLLGLFRSQGRITLHQAELDYQQVFQQKLEFERLAVDYDFRLADSYNTIETRNCTIDADGLKVHGYCLLHEARRGIDGTIEARLGSMNLTPGKIMPLLPWKIIPEKIHAICRKLKGQGTLKVGEAFLKGDYRKITHLIDKKPLVGIIGGRIYGKNLSFAGAGSIPSFLIGKAEAEFADNKLILKDFDWSIPDLISCKSGSLTLNNIYNGIETLFSGQLKLYVKGLNRFSDNIFGAEKRSADVKKEVLPIAFEQGLIAGKLNFSGPLAQPERIHWNGNFSGHDISFVLAGIPQKAKNGSALLKLDDNSLQIESASFDLATLPVNLQGTLPGPGFFLQTDNGRPYSLNLTAESTDFTPGQLNILSGEQYNISGAKTGPSSLQISLRSDNSTQSKIKLSGRMNLDWGELSLPFLAEKLDRLSCEAEFDQKNIIFKQLDLKRGRSDFSFQGSLQQTEVTDGYLLAGKIKSSCLDMDDFPLRDMQFGEDKPELSFSLNGVVNELILPVDMAGKESRIGSLWRHLKDFNFSLDGGGADTPITIEKCRWLWGGERGRVSLSGKLQLLDRLQGDIEIEAEDLDFDTLFSVKSDEPQQESEVTEKVLADGSQNEPVKLTVLEDLAETVVEDRVKSLISWKPKLARHDLNLKTRIKHMRLQHVELDGLECACLVNAAGINVSRFTGRSFEGTFNIYAGWRFADDSFMLESQLENVSLEHLNDYLKNPDRGLPMSGGEGLVSLDLYWQGDSVRNWEESLDGELDFNFHDGSLKRFTLIANISSLLNLSQFASLHLPELSVDRGVPYKELTYKGLIVGGQFEVDEFDMQGPAFNLFGSGNIDFINDQLDLKFGIQPLQTVDKILASIPLVGYIMTGSNKTFVVIPVTVRGSFDDVKIKTHTIAGMGSNLVGMVQRFFKTPVRLLRMPGKFIDKMDSGNKPDTAGEKAVKNKVVKN